MITRKICEVQYGGWIINKLMQSRSELINHTAKELSKLELYVCVCYNTVAYLVDKNIFDIASRVINTFD